MARKKSTVVNVCFSIELPYTIQQSGKWYVTSCPLLDVHSQGRTEKKALENLKEATSLFLLRCFEQGTLFEVLKECGFEPSSTMPRKSTRAKNFFDVPLPFQISESSLDACHV